MAKFALVQNGATAKNGRRRRRRRNPATATKTASTSRRRNGTTKAGAMAFAKKNGLKLVSRTVANGKRKRRHHKRRNGMATTTSRSTGIFSRNGLLGNTKSDAKRVASVIGGAAVVKIGSSIVSNFLSPYLAQVGLGKYAPIIVDAGLALLVAPMVGKHIGDANDARLGGLLVVGIDIINAIAPSVLAYTPFNASPVVLNNGSALLTPAAVNQIVAASGAPAANVAKVGSAMRAIASRGYVRNTMRSSIGPVYA